MLPNCKRTADNSAEHSYKQNVSTILSPLKVTFPTGHIQITFPYETSTSEIPIKNTSHFHGSNRRPPFRCFNCHKIGHFARNCFTQPRVRFQDEHTLTSQGTDSEGHQTINGHSSTDMQQNQNPNTYSDPQQDEYCDEEENNFEEYHDEYYDEDENNSEEYYGEDENSFTEG